MTLYKDLHERLSFPIAREAVLTMLAEYGYDPNEVVGFRFNADSRLEIDVMEQADHPGPTPVAGPNENPWVVATYIHEFDDDEGL